MTAYFPISKVIVSSRHHTEDWNVHLLLYELKSLSKGCHEEQEEDRHRVVSLTNSYTLGDLFNFISIFSAHVLLQYRLVWAKKVSLAAICLVAGSASFGLREN